jgi:transcription elongation factor Elf1
MVDYREVTRHLKAMKFGREVDLIAGPRKYETVKLKASEWYKCPVCEGTGSYETSGDLHKSGGIVPCNRCSDGVVKSEVREIKRRVRVKATSIKS